MSLKSALYKADFDLGTFGTFKIYIHGEKKEDVYGSIDKGAFPVRPLCTSRNLLFISI